MNVETRVGSYTRMKCYLLFALLLMGTFLVTGARFYSTAEQKSTPTKATSLASSALIPVAQPTPESGGAALVPFLHIVPDSRGKTVTISLSSPQPLPGMLYANLGVGPTGFKDGWTMPYSDTKKSYISTIPFTLSETPIAGSVNLTSSQGLNTVDVQFSGVEVPARSLTSIWSEDRQVELEPASDATIPFDTYVVAVTNMGNPGPQPVDHQLIGHSYSLRAASDLIETPQPMNLIWHVDTPAFTNVDLHTLDIFFWNEEVGWIPLHAQLARNTNWLFAQTNLFGTYAVFAQPLWQARFDNLDSLAPTPIINLTATFLNGRRVLGLKTRPGVGQATSRLIAPAYGLQHWGTVTYTATMNGPSTRLTVDVVDVNGNLILSNVSSGQSLADIKVQDHSALRLRAYFTSTVAGATPGLRHWQVTWQPPLPVSLSAGDANVALGQIISIPVTVTPPVDVTVGGVTLDVQYDPDVLQAVGCRLRLTADWPGLCNVAYDNDQTNRDSVRLSLLTSATITTTGTIAELSLRAIDWSPQPTQVSIANVLAVDSSGKPLPVVTVSGQIRITTTANGDVNCDEQVDRADGELILGYLVGLEQVSTACPPPVGALFLPQCDINRDTSCDVRDVQMIWRSQ